MNLKNNNPKGIVLIIIAMTFFAIQDSLIKFIFEQSSLYEIFFGRYVVIRSEAGASGVAAASRRGAAGFFVRDARVRHRLLPV